MMTLRQFSIRQDNIPLSTAWALSDVGEARGKQELFLRQSPQKLKTLREHAIIESAIASNRIEGVEIDPKRIKAVFAGKGALRDRNEQQVRGYQQALRWIHESATSITLDESLILRLHGLSLPDISDAGAYKKKEIDIIETYADGRSRVRFRTLPAKITPKALRESLELTRDGIRHRDLPPLLVIAACNLDLLCIHPFRDGNGRVSRLLWLLQLYQTGYEVGRYISLERLIEQNKERYYETLEISSQGWHKGEHNPWPYLNYLLFILHEAYREFEDRVGNIKEGRGDKTARIEQAIAGRLSPFHITEIQRACPGVSLDLIRHVLNRMKREGILKCTGRGKAAKWVPIPRKHLNR